MNIKRLISIFCVSAMLVSLSACRNPNEGGHGLSEEPKSNSQESSENRSSSVDTSKKDIPIESPEINRTPTSEALDSSPDFSEANDNSSVTETVKPTVEYTDDPEELLEIALKDAEDTVAALSVEYEQLLAQVDTYSKYLASVDTIESFYTKICETNYSLCVRMCEYGLNYAKLIVGSDMSNDDKYDELDELYDIIYDDAGDEIYDGIYDGILSDMYDDYYDGILDDAYDIAPYKEWSNARSDEYDWWSDTRSDVYGDYSDFHSDIYSFYSDIRSAMWQDDIEKAEKKIEKFSKKVDKMKIDIE